MSVDGTEIYSLLEQAENLEEGDAKIALVEEAARLADVHGDLEIRVDARLALIHAATYGGSREKALVAFSWCLAQYDQNPDLISEYDILWKYKWIAGGIANFPQIPKKQIYAVLEDMTDRYKRAGASLRPVYQLRQENERSWGSEELAIEYFQQWQDAPRDWYSDCAACELNAQVEYWIYRGNDELAIQKAEPILTGRLMCAAIPHITLGQLLLPLVRLGRYREALRYHQRGYRLSANNKDFLEINSKHLVFSTLAGKSGKAVKLFEKQLPFALAVKSLRDCFHFDLASWLLFDSLREQGKRPIKLRLPNDFAAHRDEGKYDVTELADWFDRHARELAKAFDARNENDYFTRLIAQFAQLKKLRFELNETAV